MAQQPEKKMVAIDVNEFVRTRDALGSAYISLSAAIDKAVKAYLDHTNVVLAGDTSLNISYLTQPFNQLVNTAQIAQQALHGAGPQNGAGAVEVPPPRRKKRAYKARDPNAPKRPMTAYFRYLQEQRGPLAQQLAREAAGERQKPGDLSKQVTEKWHSLTKDQQQPYRDAYQRALKDYDKEVVKYKAAGGELTPAEENALARSQQNPDVEAETKPAAEQEEDEDEEDDEDEEEEEGGQEVEDDDIDENDDDDGEDEDEEDEPAPPPPPPPAKKTPKSALKKTTSVVPPAQQFSSLDTKDNNGTITNTDVEKIPAKRKAPASTSDGPEASGSQKKRGRKATAGKAVAAPDPPAPTPAPIASMTTSSETEGSKKKKKKKSEA